MAVKLDFHQTFKRLAQSPGWDALFDRQNRQNAIQTIASAIIPREQIEKGIASDKLYGIIRSWIEKNSFMIEPKDREAIQDLWNKCKRIGEPQQDPYWQALTSHDFFIRRSLILKGVGKGELVEDAWMTCLQKAQQCGFPFELAERAVVRKMFSQGSEESKRQKALQLIQQLSRSYPRLIEIFCEEFHHFSFADKASLIAELCTAWPELFFKYFKKFNITDPVALAECGNRLMAYGPIYLSTLVTMAPPEHKWNLAMPLALLFPLETHQIMPDLGFSDADRVDFARLMLAMKNCALIFNPENREKKHFINQLILWINYDVNNRFPVPDHVRTLWAEESLNLLKSPLDTVQGARIIDWIVAHDLIPEESPPDLTKMPFENAFTLITALRKMYPEWVAKNYCFSLKS